MAQQAEIKRKSFLDVKSVQKYPAVEQLRKELEEKQWLLKDDKKRKAGFQDSHSALNALLIPSGTKNYKTFVNALFFPIVSKYEKTFARMRRHVEMSDLGIIPETYIALALLSSVVSGILLSLTVASILFILKVDLVSVVLSILLLPFFIGLGVFALFSFYPEQLVNQKRYSIDVNLPFATTHMSAVASSGIPPENIFRLLVKFSDYGGVSKEAQNITKRIDSFGQDLTTAIHGVAQQTPSRDLKELLYGILSIIESGGNLKEYLKEAAKISMFNYELIRKKYTETLATFADIYTALLIAAPLFMVSILVVINMIPDSEVGGLPVGLLLQLSAYVVIPGLNVLFLTILHITQPEV